MAKTLAQFISETREQKGMSATGLAKRSNLPLELIENIESGKELFLSTFVRQQLAKGLKVEPLTIKNYEKEIEVKQNLNEEATDKLKETILSGITEGLSCPICGAELKCRIAEMYDLEDILIKHPKARCTKCPFQLK